MTEPASDELIAEIERDISDGSLEPWEADFFGKLISRIRKEQEDKAVMARALKPFADKIGAADEGADKAGFARSFDQYEATWIFSFGDLRRARAALTGSSTIISDMEAEIERLKAENEALTRQVNEMSWLP